MPKVLRKKEKRPNIDNVFSPPQNVHTQYLTLTPDQRSAALSDAFGEVPGCIPQAKAVYEYITTQCEHGNDDFTMPAMMVPAMLDMTYKSKDDTFNFVRHHLKKYGKEDRDYVILRKNDFDFVNGDIVFKIPGKEEESIVVKKSAGNAAKWYFITPQFAWTLVVQSRSNVGRYFNLLHFKLLDVIKNKHLSKEDWESAYKESIDWSDSVFVEQDEPSKMHNVVCDKIALVYNGKREVPNKFGRSDIETSTHVFEVKPSSEFLHGVGQVLGYSKATGKIPVLCTFGKTLSKEQRHVCETLNIKWIDSNEVDIGLPLLFNYILSP